MPSLLEANQDREHRKASLLESLGQLDGLGQVDLLDLRRLENRLRERLDDWKDLLTRHVPQARQILRKLLVGRLVFAAKSDGKSGGYAFSGQGTPGRLLAGLVGAKTLASPTGFEPVLSA